LAKLIRENVTQLDLELLQKLLEFTQRQPMPASLDSVLIVGDMLQPGSISSTNILIRFFIAVPSVEGESLLLNR
jgi:hypothetical protein